VLCFASDGLGPPRLTTSVSLRMTPSAEKWSVECEPAGQSGYFFYHEGTRELPLYWEYGGGDIVVVVRADDASKLTTRHPWIVGREREILERVAGEVVRRRAPTCRAEIDEKAFSIYVREQK
jgi:hypothetical protein